MSSPPRSVLGSDLNKLIGGLVGRNEIVLARVARNTTAARPQHRVACGTGGVPHDHGQGRHHAAEFPGRL